MAYYVRIFCTSSTVPPIRKVLEWVASDGYQLKIDEPFRHMDLDSPDWKQVGFLYKEGKSSFWTEVDCRDASDNNLARDEVESFEESVNSVADSPEKQNVLLHLRETKYIVANQIPADFDVDGSEALGSLLTYFIRYFNGMVEADGEGFYDGDQLVVKIE